jgi:hypothetical protein
MMYALEMENKVTARSDVTKLEFAFCLLYLFEAIVDQYLILLLQVSENLDVKLIRLLLNFDLS